jgi:pimeloyl-ACP methyl ester carboxylesterase
MWRLRERFETKEKLMDQTRRKLLASGAAATVVAMTPRAFSQAASQESHPADAFYQRGPVRIRYQEAGSGFPLLVIPGGGLNSKISGLTNPFSPMVELSGEYRCIAADLRNANGGQSTGPLEPDRPWESFADDQLGLMDHLGIDKFTVIGFCIGGPFIWNLIKRAPQRVVAGVLAQPVGYRPEHATYMYDSAMSGWAPNLIKQDSSITLEMADGFAKAMFLNHPDFVFTVTRDFVRSSQTPVLIMPDDVTAHPYAVAMEAALLAPRSEASMFPWKEPKERIPLAVRQVHSFLKAHRPA